MQSGDCEAKESETFYDNRLKLKFLMDLLAPTFIFAMDHHQS